MSRGADLKIVRNCMKGEAMKSSLGTMLALGVMVLCVYAGTAQPPQRPEGKLRNQPGPDDRPGRRGDGPPPGPPMRWQLGKVFPPHIQDELNLSADQEKQLEEIEKDCKG